MTNLELMRKRFEFQGGVKQEDRMIKDKYRTFLKALMFSYQGCDVEMAQYKECCLDKDKKLENEQQYRALINPDKLKQDYDDKILSIDYNTGFGPGDVFTWVGTDTRWLIYLRALTEDAYFRGEIRHCKYKILFKNSKGETKYTWAAIRGPVETQIDSIQKNQNRLDVPNLTLNILIPNNPDTKVFDRYFRFMFKGRCWKVNTIDTISVKEIIEITANEDYQNEDTDSKTLVDDFVIEKVDPNPVDGNDIIGKTFIKPRLTETYEVGFPDGVWKVEGNPPVQLTPIDDSRYIQVTWTPATSGQFTLTWEKEGNSMKKVIVVESLF